MFENVYIVPNIKSAKTIHMMEQLKKFDDNGEVLYQAILIENAFRVWKDDCCYYASLYLKRYYRDMPYVTDDMSISFLKNNIFEEEYFENKKEQLRLVEQVYGALDNLLLDDENDSDETLFDVPVLFKAQDKSHRSGFGRNGMQYGETDDYAFVGVKFSLFYRM